MSGIVWISSNGEVSVGVSDRCRKDISEYMRDEPSIELTWRVPMTSSY